MATPKREFDGTTPDYWSGYDQGRKDTLRTVQKWMDDHSYFLCSPGYGGDPVDTGKDMKDFAKEFPGD